MYQQLIIKSEQVEAIEMFGAIKNDLEEGEIDDISDVDLNDDNEIEDFLDEDSPEIKLPEKEDSKSVEIPEVLEQKEEEDIIEELDNEPLTEQKEKVSSPALIRPSKKKGVIK